MAAVSELTPANAKRITAANPKSLPRITSRGYAKPLPKLMPTIRAGQVAESKGQDTALNNNNALPSAPNVAATQEPKFPPVPPRTAISKQQSNGSSIPQPPKRAISVGPKLATVNQTRTTPSTPSARPTSAQVTVQREISRDASLVTASPKKGMAQAQGSKRSQEGTVAQNSPGFTNHAEQTDPSGCLPAITKRPVGEITPSNTNQRRPITQNVTNEAAKKTSNEHRRAISSYNPTNGVRKSSREQSLSLRSQGTGSTNQSNSTGKRTSKDLSVNQSGRGVTNAATPSPAQRETTAIGANGKIPPSFTKTTASTPKKAEVSSAPQVHSSSPQPGNLKQSAVPKLALGTISSAQPEITSDPHRLVEPVVPKPQAPNTARDRVRTQFLDDKPVVMEAKPKPMLSTFTGSNLSSTINTTPKKPPPPRSATVSGLKTRIGVASPKS